MPQLGFVSGNAPLTRLQLHADCNEVDCFLSMRGYGDYQEMETRRSRGKPQ